MVNEERLRADAVTLGYERRTVSTGLSLAIPDDSFTVVVGPNACGKSTLLRSLARLLRPAAGEVVLDGSSIHRMATKEVARRVGLLPQTALAPEGITVGELVARGRYPHQNLFRQQSDADRRAVADAMDATRVTDLAAVPVDELSGGQRQRTWIAMALAQHTDILLLDEPTTFLDVSHQVDVLDLLTDLNRQRGTTIVMVLHDLNLAARYADHLIAVRQGRLHAAGDPAEVLTADVVRAVFGMESRVIPDPVSGKPMVLPIGRHHAAAGAEALRNTGGHA
jgi:ABC-type cobalamin/Fe3+-siderophores transport system ATPase subunit